jgi:6-hydroxymethylpterin diphosphokinase MptE-like protein/flagellin glycosyltransferase Maf-like protein
MAKKKQVKKQEDDGKIYMLRLQRNLDYFKKHKPGLYKMLADMQLQRVELVVTPGKDDVDMVVGGKSCYHGLAREYSLDEAQRVLQENPESKRIKTYAPPWERGYRKNNFGMRLLRDVLESSPVTPDNFKGYIRGSVFPSMVFLGCGLGYHIEALVNKIQIINAIIVEREPEKFAVSLYTVDWAKICSRFNRKGHTLTFAIGKADKPEEVRSLLAGHLRKDVPFYPFFSTYYNHLIDVEAFQGVLENANDLAVVTTNWSNYDTELLRLSNTAHNARGRFRYIANTYQGGPQEKPLVVVGSGPSLDRRIESLKAVRSQVVIVSAGTGLRPLLANGIKPDFHAEVDPSYLIYEILSDIEQDKIRDIPLLAVNEVNPHVPGLFDRHFFYLKSDNANTHLLGRFEESFSGCNPTVTNAALAIGHSLGFREVYLFGTDYGFEDESKDHSSASVYGAESGSAMAGDMRARTERAKPKIFKTAGVNGSTVLTRNDYYSAKRSVESLIHDLRLSEDRPVFYNCADGAVIEGADWLSQEDFIARIEEESVGTGFDPLALFGSLSRELGKDFMDKQLHDVNKELVRLCKGFAREVKGARTNGRRDLCVLINQLRHDVTFIKPLPGQTAVSAVQRASQHLLHGSVLHFLHAGLCHGMASSDEELVPFMAMWKRKFLEFLEQVPSHFEGVMLSDRDPVNDPWTRRTLGDDDPHFTATPEVTSEPVEEGLTVTLPKL